VPGSARHFCFRDGSGSRDFDGVIEYRCDPSRRDTRSHERLFLGHDLRGSHGNLRFVALSFNAFAIVRALQRRART